MQLWWDVQKGQDKHLIREVVAERIAAEHRLFAYVNSFGFKVKVRKFISLYGWSDVHAYEVVRQVSKTCVEVRSLNTELILAPKEFHAGGFSGHFADNHAQKYKYTSNPEGALKKIHLGKRGWGLGKWRMSDEPYKFHDYNF